MKVKLIEGKKLPRLAVIIANAGCDGGFKSPYRYLQTEGEANVEDKIGEYLIAGGWCGEVIEVTDDEIIQTIESEE